MNKTTFNKSKQPLKRLFLLYIRSVVNTRVKEKLLFPTADAVRR